MNDNEKINIRLCIEKYAGRCMICGNNDNTGVRKLNKNHSNTLSNLVLLCDACNRCADNIEVNYFENRIGVLLCGGKGTRLYPISFYNNKHTLPLSLSPMVSYPIRTLRHFGVKRVIIIVDADSGAEIVRILGSGKEYGMEFMYKVQNGANGIADALYSAKDVVRPNDEIICILGDNIFDNDEIDTKFDLKNNKACVWVKDVPNPQDYGVAKIEKDKIIEIVEKPKVHISNKAVLGLYAYTSDVFDIIENTKPSKRGELEISSINHHYAENNQLQFKTINGYWADAGSSIQRYCEASLHGAKQSKVSAQEMKDFISTVFDDK